MSKDKKLLRKQYISHMVQIFENYNANGKKTVALFCDAYYPYVDGVTSVVDNYAKRLSGDYNVVVCVPGKINVFTPDKYTILWFPSFYFKRINYEAGKPRADMAILSLFKKLNIDIIHIHSPFMMGRFALRAAKKRKIPVVATFHSQYHRDFKNIVKSRLISSFLMSYIMYLFNRVDVVWTMNEATRQTLKSYKFKGISQIVPNATDLVPPADRERFKDIARQAFGIDKDTVVFSFVGRLIVLKNILLVADSLYHLKQKGVKFKMVFVGDGADMPVLKQRIKELGIEDEVLLAGKILDRELLGSLLCVSAVHIFPSIYDTDGIVKYEAAAYSTPTLFLKGSNASSDIIDDETGYICEGDPEVIAARLVDILDDFDDLQRVGQNVLNKLYQSWDGVVGVVGDKYERLIEGYNTGKRRWKVGYKKRT